MPKNRLRCRINAGTYYIGWNITGVSGETVTSNNSALNMTPLTVRTPLTSIILSTTSPQVGTIITTTLAPADATATYQWQRLVNSTWQDITLNGKSSSYTPVADDGGCQLRVTAIGTENYTGSATSAAIIVPKTPSTVVTTLRNTVNANDNLISLREAIAYAGTGGLGTTITFAPSLYGQTITLGGTELAIGKNLTIDGTGSNISIDANQQSRVFSIGSTATVALAGLTITGGYSSIESCGILNSGTLTATNCTITGNSSSGIFNAHNYSGAITLINCTITDNSGNGISNSSSHSGAVTVTDCTITNNGGAGIYTWNSAANTLTVTGSVISGNSDAGIAFYSGALMIITSSTISDNLQGIIYAGGGNGPAAVTNCTIAGNSADGIGIRDGDLTLRNTIVAKNSSFSSSSIGVDMYRYAGTLVASNNLIGKSSIANLTNGVNGNIVGTATNPIDPMFVDAANGDYHLASNSPAINKGDNGFANGITLDLDGNARIFNGTVDIGAYESQFIELSAPMLTVGTVTTNSAALSWKASTEASGYVVEKSNDNGASWSPIENITNSSTISTTALGLTANTDYLFRIKATGTGSYCDSDWSSHYSARTDIELVAPQVVVTNQIAGVKLDWLAVPGADRYEILRQNSNGSWTSLYTTQELQYVDTTATPNVAASYIVRAGRASQVSGFNIVYGKAQPSISAPQVAVTNQPGGVKLTWATVTGADRYEILRQNSNGSWTTLGYTTALQYIDTSATPNVATSYIVRSCQGSTVSGFNIVYGKALPTIAAPQAVVTNQPGSVKLTWGVVSGAEQYQILRQNSDGSWTTLAYTTALQYIDTSAIPNVAASYIVRACQGSTVSGFTIVYGRALPNSTSAASFFALTEAEIDELFFRPIA